MKIRIKNAAALTTTLCIFATNLIGCNTATRTVPPNNQNIAQLRQQVTGTAPNNLTSPIPVTSPLPTPGLNQTFPQTSPTGFNAQRADNISKQLSKMKEIKNPHVVVYDNTALIGYTLTKSAKDAAKVKDMVSSKVKQVDKSITNVSATNSNDMVTKIKQLKTGTSNNTPMAELRNSFNKLVGNINKAVGR